MAFITKFSRAIVDHGKRHTECECGWSMAARNGAVVLQLDTYGSSSRASAPKVSQSLQIDEAGAEQLLRVIRSVFPRLKVPGEADR